MGLTKAPSLSGDDVTTEIAVDDDASACDMEQLATARLSVTHRNKVVGDGRPCLVAAGLGNAWCKQIRSEKPFTSIIPCLNSLLVLQARLEMGAG